MNKDRYILGTVGLGGVWGKVDPQESVDTLIAALEAGISTIDTAPAYGNAESCVGEALRRWQGERPQVSTKVGRLKSFAANEGYYDYSEKGMQQSVEQSLNTFDLTELDILFLHDPAAIAPEQADAVIELLLAFKTKGYTKQIGLGGNPPEWFGKYLVPEIFDVLMEYNKLNACSTVALKENLLFCNNNHIKYFAASPLNMGLLGSCFESFTTDPPVWLDRKYIETALQLKKIADREGMALHSLAQRFLLSFTQPFTIVIGAKNREQLTDTLNDFDSGPLPEELSREIINHTNKM